ncbi:hypothetical protein [Thiobacillus sedimenti]|uniref:Uncharacterized protein n=1 Tax=Thiobacillus sedimenti TaxID=3110231 RepID=A0ABZ1CRR5_9PROT|nr:hypothetical protein [Thiobacillus sp. SCUT-2]WRS40608.1 hypothetical protein VA613_06940 [Thiobacillus sp. SCUT-2]
MLKVRLVLVPGGRGPERQLGELHISNVRWGDATPDYDCVLYADDLPGSIRSTVRRYPRWSATVWDLVGRAIASALSGRERLPRRPDPLNVPICRDGNVSYVRMSDIPQPARANFDQWMTGSSVPVIEGETECAYAWDWLRFIGENRRKR